MESLLSLRSRPELPLEVWTYIFQTFSRPSPDYCFKTLLNVLSINHYLRIAASASAIWKPCYEGRYTHTVPENEKRRRQQHGNDYRSLYFARREIDRRALRLVDEIRTDIVGRNAKACIIVKEFSFDIWDVLQLEIDLDIPVSFGGHGLSDPVPHALSRIYWARMVQGVIARYSAVHMWRRIKNVYHQPVGFEEMMSGFSAFYGWSSTLISRELDSRASACRVALDSAGIQLDSSAPDYDLRAICGGVVRYMTDQGWIDNHHDPALDEHLLNSFPHILLGSPESITFSLSVLSKTWLFVCLCRRLGLRAKASMLLPNDIVGLVRSSGTQAPLVVNFAVGATLIRNGLKVEWLDRMMAAKVRQDGPASLLPPLHAILFMNAVNNVSGDILFYRNNLVVAPWTSDLTEKVVLAHHATQCAFALTCNPTAKDVPVAFPEHMADLLPLDGEAIYFDAVFGGEMERLHPEIFLEMRSTIQHLENLEERVRRRSTYPDEDIRYVVGQVLRNVHTGSLACVLGWDYVPPNTPEGVPASTEPKGHILYRMIFEERLVNIREPHCWESVALSDDDARTLYKSWKQFGRYFEDVSSIDTVEIEEEGQARPTRFTLTAEMQQLYPEDSTTLASRAVAATPCY
ncbi:hypothetical protein BN946_scf184985.g86 [Trametes cinnabarina]|uniref:Uncharacterized protein n=1 Tax=Pycnoporus cinnabarinus TaxID=5643 RepID=A0A060SDT9_PYCCI|nr:hypothetical protein BN946_scf184985.g86 [Trametes cinnabarina]